MSRFRGKVRTAMRQCFQRVGDALFNRLMRARVLQVVYREPFVFGGNQLSIAPSACVNNALFNTMSGSITVEDNVSFGHNVCVLTGTHNTSLRGEERQAGWPRGGRDILICRGAWIASNATILGPCRIGANAVVAAGAVVTRDVSANTLVGGVPARVIKAI